MVLNKTRGSLAPVLQGVGKVFARTGLSANFWTGLGLALALGAAVMYGSGMEYSFVWGGILLLASGFFDVVDGQVARITGSSSKRGAFLDSISDKIAEVAIFVGLGSAGLMPPEIAALALGMSLLVSYARAKADALNIQVQGLGIGERAERLLVIAILGMIPGIMGMAGIIVAVIAGITLAQRIRFIYRAIGQT